MKKTNLVFLAMKYHWDSQRSTPANFWAGTLGMIVNNIIILWGLWAMLFHGKPDGEKLTIYFLSLNAMITIAWGSICFFFGGVQSLAQYIEEGTLEPMLSTPRDPLLLIGISQSVGPALGDLIQGFCNLIIIFFLASWDIAIRCLFFTFVSGLGFLGLFIFMGSIAFFVVRGQTLSQLLLECSLSLSFYPTGKMFSEKGRLLLYLTPAAFTGVLPMAAIDKGTLTSGLAAIIGATAFLLFSIKIFRLGLKRYQSSSYVMARQ